MWIFLEMRLESTRNKSNRASIRSTKIHSCILLYGLITSCLGANLDTNVLTHPRTGEEVLINFQRRYNVSQPQNYLPPEPEEAFLPEVVDARSINISASSSKSSSPSVIVDSVTRIDLTTDPPTPNNNLEAPYQDGERDPRYYPYSLLTTKSTQRTSSRIEIQKGSGSIAIKVNEMSCQDSGDELYFRTSLSSLKLLDHPVVENVNSDLCKITKIKNDYHINFEKDHFWSCGVTDCSSDFGKLYCLNLRFPKISGLKMKEDATLTLQCKTQERIASRTKQINVKTLNTAARMAPRVAAGGFKNTFETDIGLYRKTYNTENIFDTKINPGGTVVLGEEILLRALVREGDGWRYSRLSEVKVHFIEKNQQSRLMNSLWILDNDGCLNPDISEISSREQYRIGPLESYLIFEAFMFENMKDTDEMIISVKVMGCLNGADCSINCPAGHARRTKRNVDNNTITDWQNDIAFKVVVPEKRSVHSDTKYLVYFCIACIFILTMVIIALHVVKFLLKQRLTKEQY